MDTPARLPLNTSEIDLRHMQLACYLARRGEGAVEPNPMVGCVIAHEDRVLATGWHERFGGPHAEILALEEFAKAGSGEREKSNVTLYVTLEPCCHHGKTPPCTDAILASGIRRVAVAMTDPYPQVGGEGIRCLRAAGVTVDLGIAQDRAAVLLAPYLKLLRAKRPWILAKWAMTLDGKIATRQGHSRWISSDASRRIVHQIRGRVDGVLVGIGTALADDPILLAQPSGTRVATRIVVDSLARLPMESQLVQTVDRAPVLLASGPAADPVAQRRLEAAGVEVLRCGGAGHAERLQELLQELGRRRMTNILAEGGNRLLGTLFDLGEIDEVHAFIAAKLVGGDEAPTVCGGRGVSRMDEARQLQDVVFEQIDQDIYVQGRVAKEN